jgi:putative spermidine/putrescine transport system ATP-binding protein
MSDRVAVFNNGVIQQIDAADRMYETPANRFVAGFIGDGTMLRGTVVEASADGRCAVVLPDGRRLGGVNVNAATPGAEVVAGIRPERVVAHVQAPPTSANVLQAQVRGIVYFGDHLRLMCHVGDGQDAATVKLPLSAASVPQPGADVWLEFPGELTRVYL